MPKSGIDLVLLFDLPDDIALKRAEGRTCKFFRQQCPAAN